MSWLGSAATIAGKDLRLELKTRDVVASVGLFVLLVVVTASFAFPTTGERYDLQNQPDARRAGFVNRNA